MFRLRAGLVGFMLTLNVAMLNVMPALADGPANVAKANYHLWPDAINTSEGFNKASRAYILLYLLALHDMQQMTDGEMLSSFKIKSLNRASVDKWFKKEQAQILVNYQRATVNCIADDWSCVGQTATVDGLLKKATAARVKAPHELQGWQDNLIGFSRVYIAEQLRLAALFPKVSSEIDRFNANELNGDNVPDRQFFLTFDDGPTNPQGSTDDTLMMLATQKKSATFFVLGKNFQARLSKVGSDSLAKLYQSHCVASHGWEHQSHAKWEQWQDSVKRTQDLIASTIDAKHRLALFRPPYGQRKPDSEAFFRSQSLQVALWNLDSQDWNGHVSADDIVDRMVTLMLIKRHGVLLFHDIHPKAKVALPVMFSLLGNSVIWEDCNLLLSM
jgi:peptidoglycan/xylan/chitin deacetylase (PgdA/CDA1 family)